MKKLLVVTALTLTLFAAQSGAVQAGKLSFVEDSKKDSKNSVWYKNDSKDESKKDDKKNDKSDDKKNRNESKHEDIKSCKKDTPDTPPTDEDPQIPDTPVTPPTPPVTPPVTPVTPATPAVEAATTTKQIATVPAGAVNAGEGSQVTSIAAVIGVVTSSLVLAYAIVRSAKRFLA